MEAGIDKNIKAGNYDGLSLAYLGDSALDLYIKEYFVVNHQKQTAKYHKDVTQIVNAINQSRFADEILPELSEEEADIFRRGRNAKPHTKAKHATRAEYSRATGLEALFGYLYLSGNKERFAQLADRMIREYENEQKSKL